MIELVSLSVEDFGFALVVSFWVIAIVLLVLFIFILFSRYVTLTDMLARTEKVTLGLGPAAIEIKTTRLATKLAHESWAELATRKAGLPIDVDYDVIVEVYDSWYSLFSELRRILRSIPPNEIRRSKDAKKLINGILTVLNDPMRDHLTHWQAKFRAWYELEKKSRAGEEPQSIQKDFADYDELVRDLLRVNQKLILLTADLKTIAHGSH